MKNIVSPFGIGRAIPRLCVYLTRWFIMCVNRREKNDVQKKTWYIQYRIDFASMDVWVLT